jgi:NADH:ubiquinone oxidoreductase subunit E
MGGKKHSIPDKVIYICDGKKCSKRGGHEIEKMLRHLIKEKDLKEEVEIINTDCTDRCKMAPIVCFQPQNIWLTEATEKEALDVFKGILKGE